MSKNKHWLWLASAASIMLTTACVDENYDLSDLDGTVGINVNELTIPLEVDHLMLDQVIELEGDGQIEEVVGPDGKKVYALIEEGEFNSDPISVPRFKTPKPGIGVIDGQLDLWKESNVRAARRIDVGSLTGTLEENLQAIQDFAKNIVSYEFQKGGKTEIKVGETHVDDAIVDITSLKLEEGTTFVVPLTIDTDGEFSKLLKNLNLGTWQVILKDLKLKLPKGLDADFKLSSERNGKPVIYDLDKYGCYQDDGVLDLGKFEEDLIAYTGQLKIIITLNGIERSKNENIKFDPLNHSFSLDEEAVIEDGMVVVSVELPASRLTNVTEMELIKLAADLKSFESGVPHTIGYLCDPDMDELEIKEVSGRVKYSIDDLTIDPVSITDLPDFLEDDNTNVILGNPQVYLKISNPLPSHINLEAKAGLSIQAERIENGVSKLTIPFTLDPLKNESAPAEFVIGRGENVFCLSPEKVLPENMLADYRGAEHIGFKGLAQILSWDNKEYNPSLAKGLPDKLHIEVTNPRIPEQDVNNFELDKDYDAVTGSYYLYAPLAIGKGSNIVYTERMDGWYDETLEKLTVSQVKLTANVNSQVPLGVKIKIKPINVKGEEISGIKTSEVKLAASTTSKLELVIKGEIKDLDGVIIEAHLDGDGNAISPEQYLEFKNLKVTVSGRYVDEM